MIQKQRPIEQRIPFSQKLFVSVFGIFILFAAAVLIYQIQREQNFKNETLNAKLQVYNQIIYNFWNDKALSKGSVYYLQNFLNDPQVRVSVIDKKGTVLFDSHTERFDTLSNHADRPEFQQAQQTGEGYNIRTSGSLNQPFFYAAHGFDKIVIRSAIPYDDTIKKILALDYGLFYFMGFLILLMFVTLFRISRRIGKAIQQLRDFAFSAENNPDTIKERIYFPNDELGDTFRYITELYARLKKSQEEESRIKRQLTQNISHELKTPVSSIQGYMETIIGNPGLPYPTVLQFVKRSSIQTERLSLLLKDLSLINQMEQSPDEMQKQIVRLDLLAEEITDDLQITAQEKNMTIRSSIPSGLTIDGNAQLIYSIFRNLFDNALHYAGNGTTVELLFVKEENQLYHFIFRDNGIGVQPEHLNHLFERFYRVDKGRSRKMGGTGLGLSIVKNGILLHKGNITVDNRPTGGLSFAFTLHR